MPKLNFVTFYVYFVSKDARKEYKKNLADIMDYIRFRNGISGVDIAWQLGTLAKFASMSVSYDSMYGTSEELVWTNCADLVSELNEFFATEPYIFSQFEGYRFEDDCKNQPDWFSKYMNEPVVDDKNGSLNNPRITCESQMDPLESFGRNKSLS